MVPSYKVTKVTITNYKGIASQAFAVGPGGAILAGPNGAGKTSARDAVVAALASKGVDPSCIREGADSSEILVNLEDATVRRRITATGATATVTNSEGDKWGKPQSRLDAIFGSMLDPLKFFLADKKEQRRLILEACPVDAPTTEDFAKWLGDFTAEMPECSLLPGLEAIERVRKYFYDKRTVANTEVKAKATDLATAEHNAKAAHDAIPAGVTIIPVERAKAELQAAESARAALITRGKQAEEQTAKMAGTRERIANLRGQADAGMAKLPARPVQLEFDEARAKHQAAVSVVEKLKEELRAAESTVDVYVGMLEGLGERRNKYDFGNEEVEKLRVQADDLEASLSAVAITPVFPEEITAAESAVAVASEAHSLAIYGEQCANLAMVASANRAAHTAAKAKAEALDKVVDALTNIAPRELMTRSNGIPGLALTEDGITLDGRNINNLCGKEKMAFAVELAKRANDGGGKLLCVDGLEALDEKNREAFVRMATADGWQLLGTLVSGDDLHVIELK